MQIIFCKNYQKYFEFVHFGKNSWGPNTEVICFIRINT